MKLTPEQIATNFSCHEFEITYPYFTESILWVNVGGEEYKGKEAVIEACRSSLDYLQQVVTTRKKCDVLVGKDMVIVQTETEYTDPKQEKSIVASCDIYQFTEEKLIAITSYNIEL
jgi:hypothetical protein